MKAMELHLEDEMLAGFGALHMVRDEEENKPLQKPVRVLFFTYLLLSVSPREQELPRNQRQEEEEEGYEEEKEGQNHGGGLHESSGP